MARKPRAKKPLPVAGYTAQQDEKIAAVNEHKVTEEHLCDASRRSCLAAAISRARRSLRR